MWDYRSLEKSRVVLRFKRVLLAHLPEPSVFSEMDEVYFMDAGYAAKLLGLGFLTVKKQFNCNLTSIFYFETDARFHKMGVAVRFRNINRNV